MPSPCPDCNKFASLDSESEVEDIEVGETDVNAIIHITRRSVCCGADMTETYMDVSAEIQDDPESEKGDPDCEHEWEEYGISGSEVEEGGGGRYAKNIITAKATVEVECKKCGQMGQAFLENSLAAGHFDSIA